MDYLFSKQDTALAICLMIYAGIGFIQLQKAIILNRLEQANLSSLNIWQLAKILMTVPLFLTLQFLI